MIIKSFEDLDVYQKAYGLALKLHKFSLKLPKIEQYALADQLRRASKSVCANIAEGFGRQRASSKEFHHYIMIAVGSSDEMKVWLSFCVDLGYMPEEEATRLCNEYGIVARMLHGLRAKWK